MQGLVSSPSWNPTKTIKGEVVWRTHKPNNEDNRSDDNSNKIWKLESKCMFGSWCNRAEKAELKATNGESQKQPSCSGIDDIRETMEVGIKVNPQAG